MRFAKFFGFFLLFSFFGLNNLSAQTQNKTTTIKKPQQKTVKIVPPATKRKIALKTTLAQRAAIARKQQIKKAVRRTNITRRPIRRR